MREFPRTSEDTPKGDHDVDENQRFDKDLYEILGVQPGATTEEIREARNRLIKRYHPDKGGLRESQEDREFWTARTAEINDAWDILKDSQTRSEYNRQRLAKGSQPGNSSDQQERDSKESPGADEADGNNWHAGSGPRQNARPAPSQGTTRILWVKTVLAAMVIIAAVVMEAEFSLRKWTATGKAETAQSTKQLAEDANSDRLRTGQLAEAALERASTATQRAWALEREARIRGIAAATAGIRVTVRARSRLRTAAAMAATAVAWTAGAASWLISTIPTDTAQRLAAWAEGLEQAATQHAIDFREASRESRQWLEAQRAALQENASEARAAADRAWQERAEARRTAQAASLQAVAAERKATRARAAADEAADLERLAAEAETFARSVASSTWWLALLSTGWVGFDPWVRGRLRRSN